MLMKIRWPQATSVTENDCCKILWDLFVQTNRFIEAQRSNMIVIKVVRYNQPLHASEYIFVTCTMFSLIDLDAYIAVSRSTYLLASRYFLLNCSNCSFGIRDSCTNTKLVLIYDGLKWSKVKSNAFLDDTTHHLVQELDSWLYVRDPNISKTPGLATLQ